MSLPSLQTMRLVLEPLKPAHYFVVGAQGFATTRRLAERRVGGADDGE
jgi:hypothetical protein